MTAMVNSSVLVTSACSFWGDSKAPMQTVKQ